MRVCPLCEGKKVVGKLSPSSQKGTYAGLRVPLLEITDQRCKRCSGTGEVTHTEYLRLTGGRAYFEKGSP